MRRFLVMALIFGLGPVCATPQALQDPIVGEQIQHLGADTAGSSSATLTSTGMTFFINANQVYRLDCNILFTVSATSGVGLELGVAGPGTPTQVTLVRVVNTSATAFRVDSAAGATWGTAVGSTATTVTSESMAKLTGTIENGAMAGTLTVEYANVGTTGTTTVKRGSYCVLR